jgi:hypothetical protein
MSLAPEFGDLPEDPDERPSGEYADWFTALAEAVDEDEVFATLASRRPPAAKLVRQQLRGRLVKLLTEKFTALESGATAAKVADAWLQEGDDDGGLLQGKQFVADEIEPWHHPVDGADALDELYGLLGAYVVTTEANLVALTLWTAYSHCYDRFGVSPILDLTSPTKRCGKSTVIVLLRHLCRSPLLSGNITPAALFRAIEAWKPTLLIDEADSFAKMHDELRGILNAGHTRETAFVVRSEGDAHEPRLFSTWAPKAVAAIGHLPDTIEDRAIRIALTRKPTDVAKRDAFDPDTVRADCAQLRRRVARFVLDNLDAIAAADVERPDGLDDRAWNNWRPLLALAAAAGPDWLKGAEDAAVTLSGGGDDADAEDLPTLALRHVWEIVQPSGKAKTAHVLKQLVARDDGSPWAKWWEKDLDDGRLKGPAARLAALLRPFGVKPKELWIDARKERGYDADDFTDPRVAPYLETDGRTVEDGRPCSSSQAGSTDSHPPTDSSEGAGDTWPLPGDDDFLTWLYRKRTDGWITAAEFNQRALTHRDVRIAGAAAEEREPDDESGWDDR